MGKKPKKEAPPKVAPVVHGEAAKAIVRKQAQTEWDKAQEEATKSYNAAMNGAWQRYLAALKLHTGKSSAGTDFDKQYDIDREQAVRQWRLLSERADKRLETALDACGGLAESTDEQP